MTECITNEKEFVINRLLSLKLVDDRTVIYVNGREFNQCKYLLLNLAPKDFELFDEIESIDDAFKIYNNKMDRKNEFDKDLLELDPEQEFIGHCSNLQAWYEHNYDLRILHSSLSIPLLRKMALLGDAMAKIRLKEEIAKRLRDGSETNLLYFIEEDIHLFEPDEVDVIFQEVDIRKLSPTVVEKLLRAGNPQVTVFLKDQIIKNADNITKLKCFFKEQYIHMFTLEELELFFEQTKDSTTLQALNKLINHKRIIDNLKKVGRIHINLEERYGDAIRRF